MVARSLLLAALWASPVWAQTPTPQPAPLAGIRGYVYDSLLTGTTLPNASVFLAGATTRTTRADLRGRFGFDSLPPGQYTVTFSHPTLDEVGYAPAERPIELRAGLVTRLFLSTASSTAMYARICPDPAGAPVGAVLGALRDIRLKRPVVGGEIRVEWNENTISRELGFTRRPRAVGAMTDSLGRYRICGIPNDAAMLLRARVRGIDGPPLELKMGGRSLAIRVVSIDLGDSTAAAPAPGIAVRGTAVLKGMVRKESGEPLGGAQVLVLGSTTVAEASPTGSFALDSLPGGTHMVEIRAIGFERRREAIDLDPDKPAELDVRLKQVATVLEELNVTAKNLAWQTDFDKRKLRNNGGHFLTREDIERRNPLRTEDIFRAVPGFTVVPSGGFDYSVVSSRGAGFNGQCSPDFYIDGIRTVVDPQIGGGIPANPSDIYGIEVYSGATTVPAEFQTQNGCGAIVIWTRRGPPRKK